MLHVSYARHIHLPVLPALPGSGNGTRASLAVRLPNTRASAFYAFPTQNAWNSKVIANVVCIEISVYSVMYIFVLLSEYSPLPTKNLEESVPLATLLFTLGFEVLSVLTTDHPEVRVS